MIGEQSSAISSYLDWWTKAGVLDAVSDRATDWLSPAPRAGADAGPGQQRPAAALNDAGQRVRANSNAVMADAPTAREASPPLAMPGDLEAFDHWLASGSPLPGALWSGPPVLPHGPVDAPLMILSDTPDELDLEQGRLFSGVQGRLVDAMLSAIGLDRNLVRIASIAFTRPPAGRLAGPEADELLSIARHHIAIARPRHLLLFGQQSCSLLTGDVVPPDGLGQRQINLSGGMRAAIAIHHPRLLLKQPLLKRPAWTALKPLKEPTLT
ncbi:uracil-DNA glycosylase [Sphingomonas lacunae]|uniref:Uracil-DNA glycosylase n=1 Tax=Sphingomonas lacunae TaxID=2698828 RepID=A0A6M4AV97_9SPHN|nr:uracil-DNA glycosylase family protein [Sphingomonas lacunae]QJQ33067.1 uracil-DNA glycosylase [Sphingomonas lacunae]